MKWGKNRSKERKETGYKEKWGQEEKWGTKRNEGRKETGYKEKWG